MIIFKKIIGSLMAGVIFFVAQVVIIVIFGYVLAKINGLNYVFHDALSVGILFGLYLGGVIAILAFVGTPRRGPPFNS